MDIPEIWRHWAPKWNAGGFILKSIVYSFGGPGRFVFSLNAFGNPEPQKVVLLCDCRCHLDVKGRPETNRLQQSIQRQDTSNSQTFDTIPCEKGVLKRVSFYMFV